MRRWISLICAVPVLAALGFICRETGPEPETFLLLEGTPLETEVCLLSGNEEGAAVYVIAGIHGDEEAGILAADRLKSGAVEKGLLYILSPANGYGAEMCQRKTEEGRDLNRNFPGDPQGWDAERLAAAIYRDIEEKRPAVVLDLHEAHAGTEQTDALGNSIICHSLDGIGELVLELLAASQDGRFLSSPFTLYGSPPAGSINRTVTEELGIPVITVETFREEPLEERVEKHLLTVEFVLEYYGLI